jgi:hypothetical protein
MSYIDIDLSRFDYSDAKILDDLYLETPIHASNDEDFFNLPVSDAYKNNKERIERDAKFFKEKTDANFQDEKYKQEKSRDANLRDRSNAIDETFPDNENIIISNKPSDK